MSAPKVEKFQTGTEDCCIEERSRRYSSTTGFSTRRNRHRSLDTPEASPIIFAACQVLMVPYHRESLVLMYEDTEKQFKSLDEKARKIIDELSKSSSLHSEFLNKFETLNNQYRPQFERLGLRIHGDAGLWELTIRAHNKAPGSTIKWVIDKPSSGPILESIQSDVKAAVAEFVHKDGQKRTAKVQLSIISSLRFPEINHRQQIVAKAHAKMYDWIFCDPKTSKSSGMTSLNGLPVILESTGFKEKLLLGSLR